MSKYKDIIRYARTHTIVLSHTLSWEVIWECAPVKGGSKPRDMSQKSKPKKKNLIQTRKVLGEFLMLPLYSSFVITISHRNKKIE